MARRLEQFPAQGGGPRRRYPWDEWSDGGVWEITRGEDYDVPTENMRVNLHTRADATGKKVKTQKVTTNGEALIFQFYSPEGEELDMQLAAMDDDDARDAIEALYADAMNIYEVARREVDIPRSDGTTQKYAANRFKKKIDDAYAAGALVPAVADIVRNRTTGFDHLKNANRHDLTLEILVIDESKPYHRFFTQATIEIARQRLKDEWDIDA